MLDFFVSLGILWYTFYILPFKRIKVLLLSTASLTGYGLHRVFEFAKKSWVLGLDIALWNLNYDLWDADYIKSLSDNFDIPVLSITAPSKWVTKKKVDIIVEMAKKLNTQVLTFSPPHITDKNTLWFSRYLPKLKRENNLSISIQNVEPKFMFFIIPEYKNSTFTQIKWITGDTTLDLLWVDSSSGMDILKAQKILGSSVKNIFFSDKHGIKRGILPWSGRGGISHLPLESFLMKLKAGGYEGYITLRVNPKAMWVGNAERVVQNLEYIKKYYEKHFLNFKQ